MASGNGCAGVNMKIANVYAFKDDDSNYFKYCKKAAEEGDANGQYYTAVNYLNGLGTKTDLNKAEEWSAKAILNGRTDATALHTEILQKIQQKTQASLKAEQQRKKQRQNSRLTPNQRANLLKGLYDLGGATIQSF